MTGVPPTAPPPSDTIERLPDDFWGSAPLEDDAPEGARRSSSTDERPTAEPSTEAADAERGAGPGRATGVAVLQRLFPGRVLSVEPHAGDEGVTADAIAGDDDDDGAANTPDDAAPDAPLDEGALESGRSRP